MRDLTIIGVVLALVACSGQKRHASVPLDSRLPITSVWFGDREKGRAPAAQIMWWRPPGPEAP